MKKSLYLTMKEKLLRSAEACNSYAKNHRPLPNYQSYGACVAYKDIIEELEHDVKFVFYSDENGYMLIKHIIIDGETAIK